MHIKSIAASGFMGGNFSHALDQKTVIQGDSFTGKTGRLNAVSLLLAGYIPEFGKAARAPYDALGTASTMEVEGCLSDNTTITRTWTMKRDSVSASAKFTGRMETDWKFPPVLIDPQEYFGKGDADRLRMVFGLVDLSGDAFDEKTISAKLKGIRIEEHTPEHETVICELAEEVGVSWSDRGHISQSLQDWVAALVKSWSDRASEARKAAKRMEGTMLGLAEIKARMTGTPPRNVEGEIAAAQTEYDKHSGSYSQFNERLRVAKQAAGQQAGRLTQLEIEIPKWPDRTEEIETLTKQVADLEAETEAYESATPRCNETVQNTSRAVTVAQGQINGINEGKTQRRKQHELLIGAGICKKCKVKLQASFEEANGQDDARIAELDKVAHAKADEDTTARQALEESKRKDEEMRLKRGSLGTLKIKLTNAKTGNDAGKKLRDEKAGMVKVDNSGLERETAQALESFNKVKEKLEGLRQQQKQFIAANADRNTVTTAETEHAKNKAELAVVVEAVKIIVAIQQDLVTTAFGRILKVANELAGPILKSPLEYSNGEIGRRRGGGWVAHKTFSGTERLITYAAISIALAASAPVRVVLLDEIGRANPSRKGNPSLILKILTLLGKLVDEGKIDQYIAVDVTSVGAYPGLDDVKVIEVESQ